MNPIQSLLGSFVKDVIHKSAADLAKREAVTQVAESLRIKLLKNVTEAYTKEVSHNISQYVKSLGEASVSISSENSGEKLFNSFQKSLKDLEAKLEQQGPDSPVIKYLQEKYGNKTESLVGRKTQPVYATVKGFSSNAWSDKPWLNAVAQPSPDVGEMLAQEASRIFDELFPSSVVS